MDVLDGCNCIKGMGPANDPLLRWQQIGDFLIALAYFSIPLELIYFVKRSIVFPYRWVLVQFGAFIILCGATHLINLWTFRDHSRNVALLMTAAKIMTAIVSCATALMLVQIIPDLLSVKVREMFLKNKAAELDREVGLIRTAEERGHSVRMLTHEIRSTLDRHTILRTTLVELAKTLQLEECSLWMPNADATALLLTHQLRQPTPSGPATLSLSDPIVRQVLATNRATEIPAESALAASSEGDIPQLDSPETALLASQSKGGDAVAVRVPLLHLASFHEGWASDESAYALMVLVLPADSARRWHLHELEMVEVVADQVAVALSHAAILEESLRARDQLMEQNVALDLARREAETAIRARNDFLAVMNHEMRTPMHAIIALSSLLQETELTPEQRGMVDTLLKSSNLLATLINDVLDLSRLEDGSLELDIRTFPLPSVFKEVVNLVKPIASVKKLALSLNVAPDVPELATGDDKRLMQTTLNVVGNAVKFTKDGSVTVTVSVERPELRRDPLNPDFELISKEFSVYIRVQVRDSGVGIDPADISKLFNKFAQADTPGTRSYGGPGLGLAICKRFVNLMDGHIWIESEGVGKGSTVTFIVRLGLPAALEEAEAVPSSPSALTRTDFTGVKVLVTDDNSVNRMVTKGLLSRLGCEVTVVGSGRECLAAVSQPGHGFQVLLLDVCMPDMDGYEVAVRIQERLQKSDRPLMVALTANTDKRTRERCLNLGMDGVLLKPISLEKMRVVLNDLLETGMLNDANVEAVS